MKAYWLNNGQPITVGSDGGRYDRYAGRYGRVIDLEDGTNPIPTFGASQDEVMGKIERTMMHSQIRMSQLTAPATPARTPPAATPAVPKKLTPEQTMQATADLGNPAKAGAAVAQLLESATGIDLNQLMIENFERTCLQWEASRPEFYGHFTNRKLIADNARMRAGGLKNITAAVLDQVYQELQAGGYLLSREEFADQPQPRTPAVPPEEIPAPRTEARPTPNFATGHRGTKLRGGQSFATWTPKYTKEQIDTMPLAKADRLIRSNDEEYNKAVEHWYGSGRRASA